MKIYRRWLIALAAGLALCSLQALALGNAVENSVAATTATTPLSKSEFDAAVAEAQRRARREDPSGQPWTSLDPAKLARMLQMPEFAMIGDSLKEPLIDQAGAWELMPFNSPSDALTMWARWFPDRGFDKPVGPDERHVYSPHVYYANAKWAPEAAAMIAMFHCLAAPVWRVPNEDPMVWALEHRTSWEAPNAFHFGKCVRKQDEMNAPFPNSPDTPRGKESAAIIEKKFSALLLAHQCTRKGPDSCLPLLRALQSLNPQHSKLVEILNELEPDFSLAEDTKIPDALVEESDRLSDAQFNAVKALRRDVVRKVIFLDTKLHALLQQPTNWPVDELEKTIRTLIKLTMSMRQMEALQGGRGDGLELDPYSNPWFGFSAETDGATATATSTPGPLAQVLTKLGKEYAAPVGCDFAERNAPKLPAAFWISFGLEKLAREQTSCKVFAFLMSAGRLYEAASKQNKPQLLEPISALRKYIDEEGPARDELITTLAWYCPLKGESPGADPWHICQLKALAVAEAKASEPQPVVEPNECRDELATDVSLDLGYAEDLPHQAACTRIPSDPNRSIVALSYIHGDSTLAGQGSDGSEDMGDYNLDVLIVDSSSGEAFSHLHVDKATTSDAWRFSGLAIDTARYNLKSKVRAFGIFLTHNGSSSVSPGSETTLNLYVEEGKKIRPVLQGLVITKYHGEWDMQCTGNSTQTGRIIKIGPMGKQGLADLIVTSTTIDSESKPVKDDCQQIDQAPRVEHFTLQYDGKKYVLPASLGEFQ